MNLGKTLTWSLLSLVLLGGMVPGIATPMGASIPALQLAVIPIDIANLGALDPTASTRSPVAVNASGQILMSFESPVGTRTVLYTAGSGLLDIGVVGNAVALGDDGAIVGVMTVAGQDQAYYRSPGGVFTLLGTLGGATTTPMAMNHTGHITGSSETADGQTHAFFWTLADGITDLGTLGGSRSGGSRINDNDQIIGGSTNSFSGFDNFIWSPGTGMVTIWSPGGPYPPTVTGLNNLGQVVGAFVPPGSFNQHAFMWDSSTGVVTDLGTMGGFMSMAWAINDSGAVVGGFSGLAGNHPFIWTAGSGATDLGILPGAVFSQAWAINAAGQVIGSASNGVGGQRGFFWSLSTGMVDLGGLGGQSTYPVAINYSGLVIGSSYIPSGDNAHAFSWTLAGGMVDIGAPGGGFSRAVAINDQNEVAGFSTVPTGYRHGFYWKSDTGMLDLGALGGNFSDAVAINNAGHIIGMAGLPSGQGHAFLWTRTSGMRDLGDLGISDSFAKAINNNDQVVGQGMTPAFQMHAFIWSDSTGMVDIGTLGGWTDAMAINDAGQVIGTSQTAGGDQHGFIWSQGTGIQDLGTLGGGHVFPIAINKNGVVVGWGQTPAFATYAFRWTQGGGMQLLPGLASYARPTGINDAGQICGWGGTASGQTHAVLWSPDGVLQDLWTAAMPMDSAVAINRNGWVVGSHYLGSTGSQAILWTPVVGAQDLGGLGGISADARAINGLGTVAGYSTTTPYEDPRAAIFTPQYFNQAPVATLAPTSLSIEANATGGALLALTGSLSSDPDGDPVEFEWKVNGTSVGTGKTLNASLHLGPNEVILKIKDPSGLTSTVVRNIDVTDSTPPNLSGVPVDITLNKDSPTGASVTLTWPTASDVADGAVSVTARSVPAGSVPGGSSSGGTFVFPVGDNQVIFTAADASGNHTDAILHVLVVDPANTGTGTNVPVDLGGGSSVPGGLSFSFGSVSAAGNTTAVSSPTGPAIPAGFQLGTPALFWDISTTAGFTPPVVISINMDNMEFTVALTSIRLMHYDSVLGWHDITDSNDGHVVTGHTDTFSPFALMQVGNLASACKALEDKVKTGGLPKGTTNELLASLEAGTASFARGNEKAGSNELKAFEQKVRAQAGKKIPQTLAAILLKDADSILHAASLIQ